MARSAKQQIIKLRNKNEHIIYCKADLYRPNCHEETHQSGDVIQHLNLRQEQKISLKHTQKQVYLDQHLVLGGKKTNMHLLMFRYATTTFTCR